MHDGQRAQERQRVGQGRDAAQVERRRHHVDVAVDHAGHQGHALGVHDLRIRRGRFIAADAGDQTVFDQDGRGGFEGQGSGVEDPAILDDNRLHNRPRKQFKVPGNNGMPNSTGTIRGSDTGSPPMRSTQI
ncbi:hypothetical protein D3C72_1760300 [compost metagenome]